MEWYTKNIKSFSRCLGSIFLLVCLAVKATHAMECQNSVSCPCGKQGGNVTVCMDDDGMDEICHRLSECEKCEGVCMQCASLCSTEKSELWNWHLSYNKINDHASWIRKDPMPGTCPTLNTSNLGSFECVTGTEGEKCTGRCWPGYYFEFHPDDEEITLICRGGVWKPWNSFSPCKPTFEWAFCQDPGIDAKSVRIPTAPPSLQGFPQNTLLRYWCDRGYKLVGERTLSCLISGEWTSSRPSCVAEKTGTYDLTFCNDPGIDANGVRWPNAPPSLHGFPKSTLLRYSCERGYNLVGKRTLFCLRSGKWTDSRPSCATENTAVIPSLVPVCQDPGQANNADRLNPDGSLSSGPGTLHFQVGQSLVYKCRKGYSIKIGNPGNITCLSSGKWSSHKPACHKIIKKGTHNSIWNCHLLDLSEHPDLIFERNDFEKTITFKCVGGKQLFGTTISRCRDDGFWSHVLLPRCRD